MSPHEPKYELKLQYKTKNIMQQQRIRLKLANWFLLQTEEKKREKYLKYPATLPSIPSLALRLCWL
jgi:hypothetical protein